MEQFGSASTAKAWGAFSISTLGMLIFAGLYFLNPKTTSHSTIGTYPVTNTVTNEIVKEVVREVPKEVEKIVKVPAEIPPEYITAMQFFQKVTDAQIASPDQVLFNMNDIQIVYILDESVKQVLSEDEVKARFELTLRRNNVPVNPTSKNTVTFSIDGFFNDSGTVICYAIQMRVIELQSIFRGADVRDVYVTIWDKGGTYGTVGKAKANEALLNEVQKRAEIFANDFLSANPKP